MIFVENGGYYSVVSIAVGSITANNLGYSGNAAPTTAIPPGSGVSPGGVEGLAAGPVFGDLSGDMPYPRVSRVDNAFVAQRGLNLTVGDVLTVTDTTAATTMTIDGANSYLLRPGASDFVDWTLVSTTSTPTGITRFDQAVPPVNVDGAVGIAADTVSNRVWLTTREQDNTIFRARRIDPDSEVIDATVDITAAVPNGPGYCAYEPVSGTLWISESPSVGNNLARIDGTSLALTTQALPGVTLVTGIFAFNGRVYVCCDAGTVFQVDPVTSVATPFVLGGPGDFMVEGDGLAGAFLWFGNQTTNDVVRVTEPAMGGLTSFATGQTNVTCVRYIPASGAGPERVVSLATTTEDILAITTPQAVMTAGAVYSLPPDGTFDKCWANPPANRLYAPSATSTKLVALKTNTATLADEDAMPADGYSSGGVVTWKPATKARFIHSWHLNGNISLAPTDTTALGLLPADGGVATFDGVLYVTQNTLKIVDMLSTLRAPGSSGTVDAEFIRLRGGVFFSLGIPSLSTLTPFETAFATNPTPPDDLLIPDDIVFVRLMTVEAGSPSDLTLQMTLEIQ